MNVDLEQIAGQFEIQSAVRRIEPIKSGLINDTFHVAATNAFTESAILQRINRRVFKNPAQIVENIDIVTRHATKRHSGASPPADCDQWILPALIPVRGKSSFLLEQGEDIWRMMSYIPNTVVFETVENSEQATAIGQALGYFHFLTSDIPVKSLNPSITGFHDTARYINELESRLGESDPPPENNQPDFNECVRLFNTHKTWADALRAAARMGKIRARTIHGDPKISNFLLHASSLKPRSIVDLDTIQPGLIHYDIGDCLRSVCNPLGEDPDSVDSVYFDIDICENILTGYMAVAGKSLLAGDVHYIFDAIRVITFELGVRFLTDYLQNNVYFKVDRDGQNLHRARTQFKLLESILDQRSKIEQIIHHRATE